MKPDWSTIDVSKLQDDFESWRQGLAYPVQKALARLKVMTQKGLTIADNMNSDIVTFGKPAVGSVPAVGVVHGVEFPFKSPSFRPRGFSVLEAYDATTGAALSVLGSPVINYNRSDKRDGWYGLTIQYAPSSTGRAVSSYVAAAGALALTTATPKTITQIQLEPGTWDVSAMPSIASAGAVTGTVFVGCISTTTNALSANIGDDRVQTSEMPTAGNGDVSQVIAQFRVVPVVSTTYYMTEQVNFTVGAVSGFGRLSAILVAPPVGTAGIVTGILWGG